MFLGRDSKISSVQLSPLSANAKDSPPDEGDLYQGFIGNMASPYQGWCLNFDDDLPKDFGSYAPQGDGVKL